MVELHGFTFRNHDKFIKQVEQTCADPKVKATPVLLVASFVPYYRASRLELGWSDPVASLRRTLAKEISKVGRMPQGEKTRLLQELGVEQPAPDPREDPKPCETCQDHGFYLVNGSPARCDHSGRPHVGEIFVGPELEDYWTATLELLKDQVPSPTFSTWLENSRFISVDHGTALILVPNAFTVEWLERRLYQALFKTLNGVVKRSEPLNLEFVWGEYGDGS